MRHARPNRTTKGVEGDRVVTLVQIVARWQENVEKTVDLMRCQEALAWSGQGLDRGTSTKAATCSRAGNSCHGRN